MYKGQTYRVPQVGGWNANPNLDHVPKEAMTDVENINIHRGGRQPRGGCEKVIDTAIASTPEIIGLCHFIREDGTIEGGYVVDETDDNIGDENGNNIIFEGSNVMCGTDDGKIYANYTTELESGLNTDAYVNFEIYYDELIISNGVDQPRVWTDNEAYAWLMGSPKACTAAIAAGAGVTAGTHSYKVTFVTASGESSGGETSNQIETAGGNLQVELTNIPIGPSGTTSRKVYRTVAGDTGSYKLLTNGTISDNTTTVLTDNDADGALGAASPSSSLAFLPTDWQSDWPKYFVKHGRGVHKRLWAIGSQSYPNVLYASKNAQADFSDLSVETIRIMTDRLTGMVEFGGTLFAFSRDKTFIINDIAINVINWGYQAAPWEGGAAHQKLIVKTPNDVAVMDETGNIFSIRATQQYGDYEAGSITKPHHIDKWIEDNIDLLQIEKFHAIYDPELRAMKWFMVRNGYDYPDVCLVYFIDFAMWTRHYFPSINHICAGLVKITSSVWRIFTGDEAGFVYKLESDILQDAGGFYKSYFKTPPLPLDNPRMSKMFDKIWMVVQPKGTEELYQQIWIDDDSIGLFGIELAGVSNSMENVQTFLGATGLRLQAEVYSEDDDDFFISEIMLDFEPLGSADEYSYSSGVFITLTYNGYTFGGLADGNVKLESCDTYGILENAWTVLTSMISARSSHFSTSISGKGYVCGGSDDETYSLDCHEFDPSANAWTARTDYPTPGRFRAAASTISDIGYIYAGNTSPAISQVCDGYNALTDVWSGQTDLPNPVRYSLGASTMSEKGYVYGGYTSATCQDCDEFTPAINSWANKTDLPSPARGSCEAVAISGRGYVIGGADGGRISDCDQYDPDGDSWVNKTDIPNFARSGHTAMAISNKGYINGGSSSSNRLLDLDEYDAVTDAWEGKVNSAAPARDLLSSAAI